MNQEPTLTHKTLTFLTALTMASVANAQDGISRADTGSAQPYTTQYPGQCTPDAPHYDLEELYAAGEFKAGLTAARKRFAADPTDADITWHLARFIFEVGEEIDRNDTSVDKVAMYSEMVYVAEKGLEIRPDDPHIRFARGVGTGRLGTTRGVIASLFSAKHIEADWLYVVRSGFEYSSIDGSERLPCDADLALGMFYRLVPDSFIVQMIAGTRGSRSKAEAHLKTADRCATDRIGTIKELGVTQSCMGTKGDASAAAAGRATLNRALAVTPTNDLDRLDQRHTRMLLDDPSIACGYSRDGQQDLDTDKIKK
jgi:hypothetical protein